KFLTNDSSSPEENSNHFSTRSLSGACGSCSMETVVGIEDNDDGKFEDSGVDRSSSALSSPKQISNPIVYKLVRVEGDGRLVPATDDEVMEVGDFLEYENSEMHVVADTGQSLECISIERSSSGKLRLECSEGTAEADLGKLNAKLQILQKVKQEEKQRISCGSPVHSHVNIDTQCSADKFPVMDGKAQSETPYQEIPSIASSLNYTHSNQSGSIDQCSRPSEGVIESGSSASAVYSNLKPDLSMSDGEICLDKLSIRELHELFKVTFGRETTVKDKQWLKRRIAMSLTNSCDVSATTFIIKDNKIVRKFEEDSSGNMNAASLISSENMTEEEDVNFKDSSAVKDCGIDDNQVVSETRLRNHNTGYGLEDENHQEEQRAAKRIRKPTKRYIEELSENESREHNPRLPISNKNMGLGHASPSSYVWPARNAFSEARTYGTRLDSLGGSDVQIPCVSRVRRSRPRKDFVSLMKFHPTDMGEAAKLSIKLLEHSSDAGNEIPDKVLKSRMPAKLHQPSASELAKEQCPVTGTMELRQELRPKKIDPYSRTSDDDIVTVPTAKGGMRRKHHRAWTIVEVNKLVEGVSRCGAGRWSEIKRLSFPSYSYRTSVDLKDKWRNLLKASFALTPAPADEGINTRKHGTVSIPEETLLRVRELAEMNSQVPPNFSSSKVAAGAGSVHGDRSGYL
ncbi:Telomere repeat-binding protein 6, partial [Mucuna pruriens]